MSLNEGDYVSVVAICSDECTYVCRMQDGRVGYFDGRLLLTEEEVYAQFVTEEQERTARIEKEAKVLKAIT